MSKEKISHKGIVLEAAADFITVQIVSQAACSSCHAAGLCGVSEAVEKEVIVPTPVSEFYEKGEEVEVSLKASMGHKAVWIAYAFPLVVLMIAIAAASASGASELVTGISGIAAVAVYYFAIWLMRDRLKNEYIFEINKLNDK